MDGHGYFVVRILGGWTVRESYGDANQYFGTMGEAIDAARDRAVERFKQHGTPTRVRIERGDCYWIDDVRFGAWSDECW